MSHNVNVNELREVKLDVKDEFKEIRGDSKKFPKYTTQLINMANQNSQGTRPKVVGQMSELIQECPTKTYEGWKNWYSENYPAAIKNATNKIMPMLTNMKDAMNLIDKDMVAEWVEDLVITKTAEGLIIQEIILKHIAEERGVNWRLATAEEESMNIDGYIGDTPVQVKSITYLSKKSSIMEKIDIEMIYYKKTDKYLYIYTE